ncbi:hypothetical protein [Streptomyces sp. NPDC021224]|uniref:hypothetical protein n=1 Tax=unclassified Streptomyces TaxID=2593676 RepID=UPI0037B49507
MQQTAIAVHVRPGLRWLFPLAIDGFIAYWVRALLVLRTAPMRARLYVWTLFGTATGVSVWANALHAVRLNRTDSSAGALRLGDQAVAALSTVAPLALAGAVHLYILVARSSGRPEAAHDAASHGDASGPRQAPVTVQDTLPAELRTAVGPSRTAGEVGDPERTPPPSRRPARALSGDGEAGRPADRFHRPDTDGLLAVARKAALAEGKLTRKVIAQAIRGQGIPLSNDALTRVMAHLRQEAGHQGREAVDAPSPPV